MNVETFDEVDRKILQKLQQQGRVTWSELGTLLGLSAPAAADRVRRLEERGFITGYAAILEPEKLCGITAFISVILERPEHRNAFTDTVQRLDQIQECHHTAGSEDYLLKVRCHTMRELEQLVSEVLKGMAGVIKTRTTVVMSTVKETGSLPLSGKEDDKC
jgi:Lrp/AsnC family leucine-responsive transcriptional regulator